MTELWVFAAGMMFGALIILTATWHYTRKKGGVS